MHRNSSFDPFLFTNLVFNFNLRVISFVLVVIQSYEAEADNEYVIRGNSVVMKCEIPSFVADFVFVDHWLDSDGNNYFPDTEKGILLRIP